MSPRGRRGLARPAPGNPEARGLQSPRTPNESEARFLLSGASPPLRSKCGCTSYEASQKLLSQICKAKMPPYGLNLTPAPFCQGFVLCQYENQLSWAGFSSPPSVRKALSGIYRRVRVVSSWLHTSSALKLAEDLGDRRVDSCCRAWARLALCSEQPNGGALSSPAPELPACSSASFQYCSYNALNVHVYYQRSGLVAHLVTECSSVPYTGFRTRTEYGGVCPDFVIFIVCYFFPQQQILVTFQKRLLKCGWFARKEHISQILCFFLS